MTDDLDLLGDVDPQGRDEHYEPTSPWWLSGTPLEAEHHRLMRRRSVPIPWDQSGVAKLTDAERARLAGTWTRRSEAEYLAISTFSVLAIDLVAAMAPADVISLCLRAGIDEIRHAEMCLRMIEIYSPPGAVKPMPKPGMSSLPDDPDRPKLHQALANTMLVSCVSETYATTVLSATRDLTTDPTAQAVLTSIYSDEVMHARLGWSYMRHAIEIGGQGVIDAAAAMLPRALRGVANVVERERPEGAVTEAVRGHGLMTPQEERVIYSTCVREVLVPGFAALGIPVGSALEDYGDAWAHAA
ncbi:MAG: ferritin-like domain-containing protein [Deltaproteobacteria bacterium]|nr:ferritin-like domain-containing protein [Deltaproteobacteria bacterium]